MKLRQLACGACIIWVLISAGCGIGNRKPPTAGNWVERGHASWYGPGFHGRKTANGETYDMDAVSAAHKELPFGTIVHVRNLDNGKTIEVRINDRGPFVRGRIIDLSREAARRIGMIGPGTARVELRANLTAPKAPGTRTFEVQVGAFRDRVRAQAIAAELDGRFQARVESSGGWHRVRVGRRLTRDEARELAKRLRRQGRDAAVVETG